MDADRVRTFLLTLPHVVETSKWGGLVFWVGDRDIGGKMFTVIHFEGSILPTMFSAGQERFHELLERDGFKPAPYMARIFWVAAERWDALRNAEWEEQLRAAHAITLAKLPPKVRATLELPKAQLKVLVTAGRAKRAATDALKRAKKSKSKMDW